MFTSIDKALIALLGAIVFLINHFFGVDLGVNQDLIASIVGAATPVLAYVVPNKKPKPLDLTRPMGRGNLN